MSGRFGAGLRAMRRSFTLHGIPPDFADAARSKQYDLAGRIASRNVDWAARPGEWDVFFRRALEEIRQQDREFQEVAR